MATATSFHALEGHGSSSHEFVGRPQTGQSCEDSHTALLIHLHSEVKNKNKNQAFFSFLELLINTEQLALKHWKMLQPRVRPSLYHSSYRETRDAGN